MLNGIVWGNTVGEQYYLGTIPSLLQEYEEKKRDILQAKK